MIDIAIEFFLRVDVASGTIVKMETHFFQYDFGDLDLCFAIALIKLLEYFEVLIEVAVDELDFIGMNRFGRMVEFVFTTLAAKFFVRSAYNCFPADGTGIPSHGMFFLRIAQR